MKGKANPVTKGERMLAKAQAALKGALVQDAKAERRAQKAIKKTQALADQWRAKSHSRVERRQKAVTRAEARLSRAKGDHAASAPDAVVSSGSSNGLSEREAQALDALRLVSQNGGAIPGAWQRASHLPGGTFSRVRKALVERGLVVRRMNGHRDVRYVLADGVALQDGHS